MKCKDSADLLTCTSQHHLIINVHSRYTFGAESVHVKYFVIVCAIHVTFFIQHFTQIKYFDESYFNVMIVSFS